MMTSVYVWKNYTCICMKRLSIYLVKMVVFWCWNKLQEQKKNFEHVWNSLHKMMHNFVSSRFYVEKFFVKKKVLISTVITHEQIFLYFSKTTVKINRCHTGILQARNYRWSCTTGTYGFYIHNNSKCGLHVLQIKHLDF